MARLRVAVPKNIPKWMGGPESALDLINPLAVSRRVLYKAASKGLPRAAKKGIYRELKGIPKKVLGYVKEAKVAKLPERVRATHKEGSITFSDVPEMKNRRGTSAHEVAHAFYRKLKPSTKKGIKKEFERLQTADKELLETISDVSLHTPGELFAEGYSQRTVREAGMSNVEEMFPPYTRALTRRLKRWGY